MKGDITHIDVSPWGAVKLIVLIGFGFGCYDVAKAGYGKIKALARGTVPQVVPQLSAGETETVV